MLNRAINFLKRKRNEKEEKCVNGGTSQAIVPFTAQVVIFDRILVDASFLIDIMSN